MTSASNAVATLLLALGPQLVVAAPVKPVLPCDRPVFVVGGPTIAAQGLRAAGSNDFATRIRTFFTRVCRPAAAFESIAGPNGKLTENTDRILNLLERRPGSIVLIHFPFADIEGGVALGLLMQAYRATLDACARSGSLCLIGGQQPVEAFSQAASERQLELERQAAAAFGPNFLPTYRFFKSEARSRRLMRKMDSGDGRLISDEGHELLFEIYRRRLMEMARTAS